MKEGFQPAEQLWTSGGAYVVSAAEDGNREIGDEPPHCVNAGPKRAATSDDAAHWNGDPWQGLLLYSQLFPGGKEGTPIG